MPARVGHVTAVYDDGSVRVRNDLTNEDWFGRLVVMSGGMICFDIVDERRVTVSSGGVVDDRDPVARPVRSGPSRRGGQRVAVETPDEGAAA